MHAYLYRLVMCFSMMQYCMFIAVYMCMYVCIPMRTLAYTIYYMRYTQYYIHYRLYTIYYTLYTICCILYSAEKCSRNFPCGPWRTIRASRGRPRGIFATPGRHLILNWSISSLLLLLLLSLSLLLLLLSSLSFVLLLLLVVVVLSL